MTAPMIVDASLEGVPGVRIEDVLVGERARKDYGDLTTLKDSIAEHGVLQPIVLLPDNSLLCGGRRLEACRQLGWESMPFVRSSTQSDAISRLKAERDENTCRKDMNPSELVAIGKKLEELKRPEADQRLRDAQERGRETRWDGVSAAVLTPSQPPVLNQTRKEVADALGMREGAYTRAKRVVETAESDVVEPEVREVAQQAQADMDAGRLSITAAHKRVKQAIDANSPGPSPAAKPTATERLARIAEMAADGHTSDQIAKAVGHTASYIRELARSAGIEIAADKVLIGTSQQIDSNRVLAGIVDSVTVPTTSLALVDFSALDRALLGEWKDSLSESIRTLTRLRNRLEKELSHGEV